MECLLQPKDFDVFQRQHKENSAITSIYPPIKKKITLFNLFITLLAFPPIIIKATAH